MPTTAIGALLGRVAEDNFARAEMRAEAGRRRGVSLGFGHGLPRRGGTDHPRAPAVAGRSRSVFSHWTALAMKMGKEMRNGQVLCSVLKPTQTIRWAAPAEQDAASAATGERHSHVGVLTASASAICTLPASPSATTDAFFQSTITGASTRQRSRTSSSARRGWRADWLSATRSVSGRRARRGRRLLLTRAVGWRRLLTLPAARRPFEEGFPRETSSTFAGSGSRLTMERSGCPPPNRLS